jgi:hypothetical protein
MYRPIIRLRPGYVDAMVFQPMPLFLSLRNRIATVLGNPLPMVKTVRKKDLGPDAPLLLATYTEAVTKFTKAATELMEYARLLTEARNAYQLRQKENELAQLRREIDSLKLVIPLLIEDLDVCQTENGQRGKQPPVLDESQQLSDARIVAFQAAQTVERNVAETARFAASATITTRRTRA